MTVAQSPKGGRAAKIVGESARARRGAALERAAVLAPRDAARELAVVAELDRDPILMVAAAEAALAASSLRDPSPLKSARAHARAAHVWLDGIAGSGEAMRSAGISPEDVAATRARADDVLAAVGERERALRVGRNGRGEMISGGVLTAIGVGGLGLMTGGLFLDRAADRELSAAGLDGVDELAPGDREAFAAQMDRAATMTAVGAVVGVTASALGVTLVAVGARDLKRSGALPGQRARLRVSPALTGVVISGRF